MKMGVVSAILDGWSFEEMIDTLSEMGFSCVEVACWPQGKAERRYAGVSHIDVDNLTDEKAEYILNYCKEKKVENSRKYAAWSSIYRRKPGCTSWNVYIQT
jgi:hypothetical protein